MSESTTFYAATYGNFTASFLATIRTQTYGEDIGQNSWLTATEYRRFIDLLALDGNARVLDIGSGSGGPALFLAQTLGCRVDGIEINEMGVRAATESARHLGLEARAQFVTGNAAAPLPFPDETFTAITCIDAINHLPGRDRVLAECFRILRRGGRILYTDPVVMTGLVSNEEIATRSSIGYSEFAPPGADERLLHQAGFDVLATEDATENIEAVSQRWYDARASHREALIDTEGEAEFASMQRGMSMVHQLSRERRLSRLVFLAQKPTNHR